MTELIFDRTRVDVVQGTEKGFYGSNDLNRVEGAVAQLLEQAKALDIYLPLVTKTDWALTDTFSQDSWPTKQQMARYLGNVSRLCAACGVQMPLPATMENLNWEGANQIERALYEINRRITAGVQTFRFSGEVFAGEENII